MELSKLNNIDLINHYSDTVTEMKNRGIIHSNNVLGDLGEYFAIEYYTNTPGLPKLQFAPPGTKNIDAISIRGDRYSIKSMTTNTTGAFYGIKKDAKYEDVRPVFEYLIILKFDKDYKLEYIIELDWDNFFKHKKWHSRIQAHNINVTKAVMDDATVIFSKDTNE